MSKIATLFCLTVLVSFSHPATAQIELNGSIDFEFSRGGKDSRFITNGIASEFREPHFSINQLNLFAFAAISDEIFFDARLQFDTWGSGRLNNLRVTLANVSWIPEDKPVSLSVGRFISPFGLYPKRQLASDNLFVTPPLAYSYFVNVSERLGMNIGAGNTGTYTVDNSSDVGLTTVYFGGYNTGGLFNWTIVEQTLNLELAAINAAVASPVDYTNLANAAGIARLSFQPWAFWRQGISASHGSFMQSDPLNTDFEKLERFRQTVVATDLVLGYSYFELSGEFMFSRWNVPCWLPGVGFYTDPDGDLTEFDMENYTGYADLKFEPPFLTGSYVAVRYDIMRFQKFDSVGGEKKPWDHDVDAYAVALGYKLTRNVLFKVVYADQETDNKIPLLPGGMNYDPDDYSIRSILSVSF